MISFKLKITLNRFIFPFASNNMFFVLAAIVKAWMKMFETFKWCFFLHVSSFGWTALTRKLLNSILKCSRSKLNLTINSFYQIMTKSQRINLPLTMNFIQSPHDAMPWWMIYDSSLVWYFARLHLICQNQVLFARQFLTSFYIYRCRWNCNFFTFSAKIKRKFHFIEDFIYLNHQ